MPVHTGQEAWPAVSWRALGTTVRLVVTDAERLEIGRQLLGARLTELDRTASRFRPDSEIVRLNAAAGRAQPISPLLAELVASALTAAALTGGDLDPTVGTSLAAAGYDRDFELVPRTGPAVRVRVHAAGWRDIILDAPRRLLTVPAGVQLDLGATAKAHAADRAASELERQLGCGVLISLGGDIAVAGAAPAGGWTVRVQDVTDEPEHAPVGPWALVTIRAGGLATSSSTSRRWQRGATTWHHILDPHRGEPAAPVWRTVSVAAGSALDANIASTAAIIRGHAAPAWLEALGLPARLVRTDGRVVALCGWPATEPQ